MAGLRPLFQQMSFALPAARWLMLTGPNGSGKTTLLRAIAGLVRPAAGELLWHGQAVRAASSDWRARFAYQGHGAALKDTLTAAENLALAIELDRGSRPAVDEVNSSLERVGLGRREGLAANRLSAGQRRRLQLARLAASPRALWLLDEPGNALDSDGQALLGTLLGEHLARGGCAVVATHQPLPVAEEPLRVQIDPGARRR